MSDKVVLMNAGQVAQCGTPQELYETPANTFAAGFIGTPPMNLLPAAEVRFPATLSTEGAAAPSEAVFGVRPENLMLGSGDAEFSVAARVHSIEYEGNVFLIHMETPSGERLVVSHSGESVPEDGAEVRVGWTRAATHMFATAG